MKCLQSGIQRFRKVPNEGMKSNGLLIRGVVLATYVVDDDAHPELPANPEIEEGTPIAVYCDVLSYSFRRNNRFVAFRGVLVSQERGGLHGGDIYKPKATTKDVTGAPLSIDGSTNPAHMDGDHVLIGFMDDDLTQPIILRGIPHPSVDAGKLDNIEGSGRLRQLRLVDGDPRYLKHHGSYCGLDDSGNHVIDTTWANDGTTDDNGVEPLPPTDGKGSQKAFLPADSEWGIQFLDKSDPKNPVVVAAITGDATTFNVTIVDPSGSIGSSIDGDPCYQFTGSESTAKLVLGDGLVKAAVADHMETLWNAMKSTVETWAGSHIHPSGVGPTGTGTPLLTIDSWDPDINSNRLFLPDTI